MAYSGIIVQRVLCCRVGPVARDSKKPRPGCACGGLPVFCGWVIGRGGDIPAGDLAGVMQQAQPFALAEVQLGVRPRPGGGWRSTPGLFGRGLCSTTRPTWRSATPS